MHRRICQFIFSLLESRNMMSVLSGQRGLILTAQPAGCALRRGPFHPPRPC